MASSSLTLGLILLLDRDAVKDAPNNYSKKGVNYSKQRGLGKPLCAQCLILAVLEYHRFIERDAGSARVVCLDL